VPAVNCVKDPLFTRGIEHVTSRVQNVLKRILLSWSVTDLTMVTILSTGGISSNYI
jgi:hypothetical protein